MRAQHILFSFIFIFLYTTSVWADPEFADAVSWYRTQTALALDVSFDDDTGDKDNPIKLYLPFQTDAGTPDEDEFYARASVVVTADIALPEITVASSTLDGRLLLSLTNNASNSRNFQVGIRSDSNDDTIYEVLPVLDSASATSGAHLTTSSHITFTAGQTKTISIDLDGNTGTSLKGDCSPSIDQTTTCVIAVWATQTSGPLVAPNAGQEIDEEDSEFDSDTALYFQAIFSDDSPTDATVENPAATYERGDEEIFATWNNGPISDTGFAQSNIRQLRVAVLQSPSSFGANNKFSQIIALAGVETSTITDSIEDKVNGTFKFENLVNGVTYNIVYCVENDWGFCTHFSIEDAVTPTSLETFLDSQSCYLLSAGFKDEHYVLSYLRAFRDETLMSFWLGEKFVEYYYGTAPKYALKIAKNEFLSAIFRGIGYFFYGFIKYFFYILGGLLLSVLGLIIRKFIFR